MFGFGNQNKEKLEQNMEEIKRMVDEESDMPEFEESSEWQQMAGEDVWGDENPENELDGEQQGSMEEIHQNETENPQPEPEPNPEGGAPEQEAQQQRPTGEEFQSFNDTIDGSKELQQEIESFEESMEQEMEDEQWEKQQQIEQSPRQRTSKKSNSNRTKKSSAVADIPEPAKTRKIDVPEIEKGPLFIRQNKFESATQLIYDMKYLADEIQSIVNTIEGDLERDRDTENQLIEALSEFEDGRTQVERIISPGEE